MAKAYKFDEQKPRMGHNVAAFRTKKDMEYFLRIVGGKNGAMKYWEINGIITNDEGGPDGITIKVSSSTEIRL